MRKALFDEKHHRLFLKRAGSVSLQDFAKGIEEVQNAPYAANIEYWIMDLLDADLRSITADDVNYLARAFKKELGHINVILIVSVINFGFANMFCTLAEIKDSHIFFDKEKALKFLDIPKLPL